MPYKAKKIAVLFIALFAACLFQGKAFSQEDKNLYLEGYKLARNGDADFAFARYQMILENYPKSEFIEDVLFSVGEYYFSMTDYANSVKYLSKFVVRYPESKALPFALAYLARIAKDENKESLVKNLERAIISFKQTSLLFRNFKEHKYLSGLYKKYKAVYFIDRIEIYVNNELFAKIPL